MRRLSLVLVIALIAAACGTGSDLGGATSQPSDPSTTMADETTTTADPGAETTSSVAGEPSTTSGRELAPDFTLQLGDGGTYTLSEGEKPVYLVFWAEW